MNTSKHTPGPWNIRYAEDRADAFIEYGDRSNITDRTSELIAQCFMHDLTHEANARLIAAAPDLLAALREAVELIEFYHGPRAWDIYRERSPEMKRLNAALAKAEGKS